MPTGVFVVISHGVPHYGVFLGVCQLLGHSGGMFFADLGSLVEAALLGRWFALFICSSKIVVHSSTGALPLLWFTPTRCSSMCVVHSVPMLFGCDGSLGGIAIHLPWFTLSSLAHRSIWFTLPLCYS
jgi:hypothetical protein